MRALTRAEQKLVERCMWIVEALARRLARRYGWARFDDLRGTGYEALVRCVVDFRPALASWETYATIRARGAMLNLIAQSAPMGRLSDRARASLAVDARGDSLGRSDSDLGGGSVEEARAGLEAHLAGRASGFLALAYWLREGSTGGEEELVDAHERHHRMTLVRETVRRQPERVQTFFEKYFVEDATLAEIAQASRRLGKDGSTYSDPTEERRR